MKYFAQRKRPSISLVGALAAPAYDQPLDYERKVVRTRRFVKRSFQDWPHAIALPSRAKGQTWELVSSVPRKEIARGLRETQPWLRRVTTDDYIAVMLATVGESYYHCTWPRDVVAKFLAADVITRGSQ